MKYKVSYTKRWTGKQETKEFNDRAEALKWWAARKYRDDLENLEITEVDAE